MTEKIIFIKNRTVVGEVSQDSLEKDGGLTVMLNNSYKWEKAIIYGIWTKLNLS